MRRPRLLFYAVNGLGMGHVTRLLAIARKVRALLPEAEIVFLTSSEADNVLFREGFATFKVPSKTLRAEVNLRSATYARMLQTVTLNLLAAFNPHLLIVDTFPAGIVQELLPVLRWGFKKVFVYRAQRPEAAESALMQNTLCLYDLAIVPHAPGEEAIFLPDGLESCWTGPIFIRDRTETRSREEARQILGLPPDIPVVYIAFGGGGDREGEIALTRTLETLSPRTDLHFAVAHAPLSRGPQRRQANVTPVAYYPMAELFPAFDAAFSAAGYNTAMELLHHGVPAAFVPFARQVDDQEARARRIAEAGAGLCLTSLQPAALNDALNLLLEPNGAGRIRAAAQEMVPDNGAERAALALAARLSV